MFAQIFRWVEVENFLIIHFSREFQFHKRDFLLRNWRIINEMSIKFWWSEFIMRELRKTNEKKVGLIKLLPV